MNQSVGQRDTTASPVSGGAVVIREAALDLVLPLYAQPEWQTRFPWLFQATTGAGADYDFDLSFFGHSPSGKVLERWRAIRQFAGFESMVHARQVHGAQIIAHDHLDGGILLRDDADGHVTGTAGLLLAISIADCVPIFLVDASRHAIALLHAGWRGVAAGMLERGIGALLRHGAIVEDLHCHLGPAICGRCYEVGPEVHEALGQPRPETNSPVDLYAVLVARALAAGIPAGSVSQSAFCTRCDHGTFFSHRAGQRERQMGLLGIRRVV
ncbi:MAG: polyphenol oxidase family protein [Gemmatimonadota bacterium]